MGEPNLSSPVVELIAIRRELEQANQELSSIRQDVFKLKKSISGEVALGMIAASLFLGFMFGLLQLCVYFG